MSTLYPINPITGEPFIFCRYCGNVMRHDTIYSNAPSRPNMHIMRCENCGAASPLSGTAAQATQNAALNPLARILTFSELWQVPAFWLETKSADGTMLAPDAVKWDREKVMAEKPAALLLYSGMARNIGLFYIQWRAWSAKPLDLQMEHVAWMDRKERDEWLQAAQDETWKAVNSR